MFNPKVSDFLNNKKDITVMGFFWSGFWRLVIVLSLAVFFIRLFS